MPIYQDVTAPKDEPALGVGAATDAIGLGGATDPLVDVPDSLPEMTPEMYSQIWGQTPGSTTTTTSGGGGVPDRGPAMRMEDLGGTAPGDAGKVIRAAKQMLGLPYVWGGTSKVNGVDCSGLILLAFQAAGINMPRISADQARTGRRVPLGQLRPGDIVSWDLNDRNNGADHIALYIGGGRIIEAPKPGENVRIRKLGRHEGARGSRVL